MKTRIKFSFITWIYILLVLCFIISIACKKPETGWRGKIETIDGVKVVHNFEPDPEESFKPIEFIVDLSIGEEEDDENYMFSYPRNIDADSQGNIYVLDSREFTIKKYDSQGIRTGLGIYDPEVRKIVEYYALFSCISIDEKDRIWVEHYEPFWRDKPRTETSYDVFSSDGKFLFSTQIDKNVYPKLIFKNGYIYTLSRDESGYTTALRLRMVEE